VVDTGVSPHCLVEIPAHQADAADRGAAATTGPVGSVGSEGADCTAGAGAASFIAAECLPRDQVIRGTASIGCCAAEDADGIEPERLLRCAPLSNTERGHNMVRSDEDLPDRDR